MFVQFLSGFSWVLWFPPTFQKHRLLLVGITVCTCSPVMGVASITQAWPGKQPEATDLSWFQYLHVFGTWEETRDGKEHKKLKTFPFCIANYLVFPLNYVTWVQSAFFSHSHLLFMSCDLNVEKCVFIWIFVEKNALSIYRKNHPCEVFGVFFCNIWELFWEKCTFSLLGLYFVMVQIANCALSRLIETCPQTERKLRIEQEKERMQTLLLNLRFRVQIYIFAKINFIYIIFH